MLLGTPSTHLSPQLLKRSRFAFEHLTQTHGQLGCSWLLGSGTAWYGNTQAGLHVRT